MSCPVRAHVKLYAIIKIGSKLLEFLTSMADTPVLIGIWADAHWAISFYEKHKFCLLSQAEKEILLKKYWTIPARQIETSVVLASPNWFKKQQYTEASENRQSRRVFKLRGCPGGGSAGQAIKYKMK